MSAATRVSSFDAASLTFSYPGRAMASGGEVAAAPAAPASSWWRRNFAISHLGTTPPSCTMSRGHSVLRYVGSFGVLYCTYGASGTNQRMRLSSLAGWCIDRSVEDHQHQRDGSTRRHVDESCKAFASVQSFHPRLRVDWLDEESGFAYQLVVLVCAVVSLLYAFAVLVSCCRERKPQSQCIAPCPW